MLEGKVSVSGFRIQHGEVGIWAAGVIGTTKPMESNISNNLITSNGLGLGLCFAHNNLIADNIIWDNSAGIWVDYSNNNTISGNNIGNNEYGINFSVSSNNKFCSNNYINNTQHVYDYSWDNPTITPSINFWDNGFEGNYWSGYNGTDNNTDGIGDTPYVIDENNQDDYPIIPEFPTWTSMLLILIVLTVAIVIYKRRPLKTPIH